MRTLAALLLLVLLASASPGCTFAPIGQPPRVGSAHVTPTSSQISGATKTVPPAVVQSPSAIGTTSDTLPNATTYDGWNISTVSASDDGIRPFGLVSGSAGPAIVAASFNATYLIREKHEPLLVAHWDRNLGSIKVARENDRGEWLVFNATAAFLFASTDDLANGTPIRIYANVTPPIPSGLATFDTGSQAPDARGFLWGEYILAADVPTLRLFRLDATGYLGVALALPRPSYRHFHNINADPYANGSYYATTGDSSSQVQFFHSNDYGKTWSAIPGTTGSQRHRTVGLVFTAGFVYWALDGFDGNPSTCKLMRALRDDLSHPTTVAILSSQLVALGIAKTESPPGIIVGMRDDAGILNLSRVPILFYSFSSQTLTTVAELPTDYGPDRHPGVFSAITASFQGDVYLVLNGVVNPSHALYVGVQLTPPPEARAAPR